ncbi:MAG TPA: hypothetical protein VG204_08785 [Terriglobia bacterium]|nr:hypothetical protein [Terriglobia bacterium]
MPYETGERLPGERASRLGHLDVLKSPLVRELCESFEDPRLQKPQTTAQWHPIAKAKEALPLVFGIDGSIQVIESETKPHKALGFVKTALVMLDQPALATIDKVEPHPFAIRDILEQSQLYHATVFPLRYVYASGQTIYNAVRRVIYDSLRDPSLEGQVFETLKWLAYEKWDGQHKALPEFECPHCHGPRASLPYDSDEGECPQCDKQIFVSDMLGFHQVMAEDAAPDSVASDYMGIHETLLLFTGVRYFWEKKKEVLGNCLFVKDGPLSIRAQYSKLVNPIRRFLVTARAAGVAVCMLGQEKSGAFWDHLQLIGDDMPSGTIFVPDHSYIREQVQHRPVAGAIYGKDTNYGAKVFVRLDDRHKFVLNIPNGSAANPQDTNLIGAPQIFATLESILSARYEDGLLPVELAHSIASLSTYPSAKVLAMFAEAAKCKTA